MTDKELLELAAKAAGYECATQCDGSPMVIFDNFQARDWNPLTDDGDALRLACDLGLRVYPIARTMSGKACSAVGSSTCERLSEVSDIALDTRTATRLAITRAAAEIGKTLG